MTKHPGSVDPPPGAVDDRPLVDGLKRKDEAAFRTAIRTFQPSMLQLARNICGDKIADEVVQEAWVSVMNAIDGFEHRSRLKTWLLRIVANEAKTRLRRENRHVSLEALTGDETDISLRFDERDHWRAGAEPSPWRADSPEDLLSSGELGECMEQTLARLPEMQRATLRLREYEGYSLQEICNILDVSESNVRVLLHRARSRLFGTVEHFQQTGECL